MPYAHNTNPEITFVQSIHQSIRMECRRTSWKHVEPNIITYYCFDEHHKYSTIITQYAEIVLLSHNMLKYFYYYTICSNTTIIIAQRDKSTNIDVGARGSAREGNHMSGYGTLGSGLLHSTCASDEIQSPSI